MTTSELPLGEEQDANDQLERRAGSYRALYGHWERNQWSAVALDGDTAA